VLGRGGIQVAEERREAVELLLLAAGLLISFWLITLVFLLPNPQRYPFRARRARKAGKML